MTYMPVVDKPDNLSKIFQQAWKTAGIISIGHREQQIIVVTPERNLLPMRCPPVERLSPEVMERVNSIAPPRRFGAMKIAVIAFTETDALQADPQGAIPWLGYFLGMGAVGHKVILFEGDTSALGVGCRGADLLIIDSGMLPHIPKKWAKRVLPVMNKPEVLLFSRDGKLKQYSLDGKKDKNKKASRAKVDIYASVPQNIQDTLSEADKLIQEKRYQAALKHLAPVLELNQEVAVLWHRQGQIRCLAGDKDGGIEDFDRVIRLARDYPGGYYDRAHALADTGWIDEAIRDYTQVTELDPQHYAAHYMRGLLLIREKNRQDEAIDAFTKALSIEPELVEAYIERAVIRLDQGQNQAALSGLNRAIELNPLSTRAYYERGLALLKIGDAQAALADFMQSYKLNPSPMTLLARAQAYDAAGKIQQAIEDYQGYLVSSGNKPSRHESVIRQRIKQLA